MHGAKRERERKREREQSVRHQSTKIKREIKWKVLDGVQKAERGNWQDEKRKKKKRWREKEKMKRERKRKKKVRKMEIYK